MSLLGWHESLFSVLAASFFFREQLRPSPLPAFFLPGTCEEQNCTTLYEQHCCEHWVLSHSAHTANRCYSENNKTQTDSKREHFSSSPYQEAQAPTRRPAAKKKNQPLATRAKAWQAIPEVSNWVLGIIKLGYTLQFALKSPSFEPLQSVDLRPLMLKTALLLAWASLKYMGDLQALSVSPSCL